jgi:hypothetical protein
VRTCCRVWSSSSNLELPCRSRRSTIASMCASCSSYRPSSAALRPPRFSASHGRKSCEISCACRAALCCAVLCCTALCGGRWRGMAAWTGHSILGHTAQAKGPQCTSRGQPRHASAACTLRPLMCPLTHLHGVIENVLAEQRAHDHLHQAIPFSTAAAAAAAAGAAGHALRDCVEHALHRRGVAAVIGGPGAAWPCAEEAAAAAARPRCPLRCLPEVLQRGCKVWSAGGRCSLGARCCDARAPRWGGVRCSERSRGTSGRRTRRTCKPSAARCGCSWRCGTYKLVTRASQYEEVMYV